MHFWTPRTSIDPRVKNYQWGDLTAGLFEAKEHGYDTTILLDHDGHVTEGPGFNVFSVQPNGKLVTAESGMLEGISRRTVLEICRALGYKVEVRPLPLEELTVTALEHATQGREQMQATSPRL